MKSNRNGTVAALLSVLVLTGSIAAQGGGATPAPACDCGREYCLDLTDLKTLQTIEGRLTLASNAYILRPERPVCARGSGSGQDEFGAERDWPGETEIHVAPNDTIRETLKAAVGAKVALRGHPFPAHTAWHRTNIVFEAVAVELPGK